MRIEVLAGIVPALVQGSPDGFAPSGGPLAALPALALLGLGALHGVNPGMGWLFAVGLGLQRRSGAAVWRALPPMALGHAVAIGAALAVAGALGSSVPPMVMKWGIAAVLAGFGVYRLFRTGHPRYGGMLVGARELATWSFLMASAHGAGLMVVPFVLGGRAGGAGAMPEPDAGQGAHATHVAAGSGADPTAAILASALHTVGYLVVAGLVAWLVYRRFGLRILRTHWVNLDLVWSGALILTGVLAALL